MQVADFVWFIQSDLILSIISLCRHLYYRTLPFRFMPWSLKFQILIAIQSSKHMQTHCVVELLLTMFINVYTEERGRTSNSPLDSGEKIHSSISNIFIEENSIKYHHRHFQCCGAMSHKIVSLRNVHQIWLYSWNNQTPDDHELTPLNPVCHFSHCIPLLSVILHEPVPCWPT